MFKFIKRKLWWIGKYRKVRHGDYPRCCVNCDARFECSERIKDCPCRSPHKHLIVFVTNVHTHRPDVNRAGFLIKNDHHEIPTSI